MATHSYNSISDYVLDQIYGYQNVNAVHENVRYLTEDMTEIGSSSNLSKINIADNAVTPGTVYLYFGGGTTYYISYDGTDMTLNADLALEAPPDGRILQSRFLISFYSTVVNCTNAPYLGGQSSNDYCGFTSPYDASIIGFGVGLIESSAVTVVIQPQCHVNGSSVLTSSNISIASGSYSTTNPSSSYTTQARNVDTIDAGDEIDIKLVKVSGTDTTYYVCGWVELVVET